jgi:hypothetical protein
MKKKFRITISEDNVYTCEVEAQTKAEAEDIALSGELDYKYKDTLYTDIIETEEIK